MRLSSFKKFLDSLGEEELRDELLRLYTKLNEVKKFYKMDMGSDKDRQRIFDKAKKEIAKKYLTKSYRKPRRPRIQKVNKILSDTKKSTVLDYEMIDIYLFTAETAVNFMREYGFYSEVLENNIARCYEKAKILIQDNLMEEEFADRIKILKEKAGWSREVRWRLERVDEGG